MNENSNETHIILGAGFETKKTAVEVLLGFARSEGTGSSQIYRDMPIIDAESNRRVWNPALLEAFSTLGINPPEITRNNEGDMIAWLGTTAAQKAKEYSVKITA